MEINQRVRIINALLDNAEQGFLFVDADMFVGEEYSLKALEIFAENIEREKFAELIYPNDKKEQEFVEEVLFEIFNSLNPIKVKGAYLPLLPQEMEINNKYIRLDYKLIRMPGEQEAKVLMVTLTDITKERRLKDRINQERRKLAAVVKVVINYNEFIQLINNYRAFYWTQLEEIISSEVSLIEIVNYIFRKIHNFKGGFALFKMTDLAEYLHEVEEELIEFKEGIEAKSREELRNILGEYTLLDRMEEELDSLKGILGADYFNKSNIREVTAAELIELEEDIASLEIDAKGELLNKIRRMRYMPLKELFSSHKEYVEELADRMNKEINPLVIKDGEFLVDKDRYYGFVSSLIHIFHNMIDHGIETPEERLNKAKEEAGTLKCDLRLVDEEIIITLSDDGQGLDWQQIRNKVDKDDVHTLAANDLTDKQLKEILFSDGFSTKEEIDMVSGRGTGLAVVKKELENLAGKVQISTEAGVGTSFKFILPAQKILTN